MLRTARHWTKQKKELPRFLLWTTLDVQYQDGAGDSQPAYTFHSPTFLFFLITNAVSNPCNVFAHSSTMFFKFHWTRSYFSDFFKLKLQALHNKAIITEKKKVTPARYFLHADINPLLWQHAGFSNVAVSCCIFLLTRRRQKPITSEREACSAF